MKKELGYLLAGIDESNHISEYANHAEIVTAVFSPEALDGTYRAYSKSRDEERISELKEWMQSKEAERDYRFAVLTNMEVRRFQPIAAIVTVPLIKAYLESQRQAQITPPENLRLFVDGLLSAEHRDYITKTLLEDFETVMVRNIIKRDRIAAQRRKGRKLVGPDVIKMADILAYQLYNGYESNGQILSPGQLFNHPKRVILNEETLLELIKEERRKKTS